MHKAMHSMHAKRVAVRLLHTSRPVLSASSDWTPQYVQQQIAATQPFTNAYIQQSPTNPASSSSTPTSSSASTPSPSSASPYLPLSVKDNFLVNGWHCTAGSRILKHFSATDDSTAVEHAKRRGWSVVGKTNMDEFGMGSFNTNSYAHACVNPWSFRNCRNANDFAAVLNDPAQLLSPGGSSGGAAASIASHTCLGALGSDTGGSIRLPAAYCGVMGIKPTYGRVSRYGLIAYASSLDTPSIMAKSTPTLRHLLNSIEGFDSRDSTCIENLAPTAPSRYHTAVAANKSRPFEGLTVGMPHEYNIAELGDEVRQNWFQMADWLQNEGGARVVWVNLPHTKHALPAYYILAPAEAMSNLSRYDGVRFGHVESVHGKESAPKNPFMGSIGPLSSTSLSSAAAGASTAADGPPQQSLQEYYTSNRSAFGPEVQRRILMGSFVLSSKAYSSYFVHAQQIRRAITQDFQQVFSTDVDLLLAPTCVGTALSFQQIREQSQKDAVTPYLNDIYTIPSNLAGIPSMSVPVSLSKKEQLPISLQLLGNYHSEGLLMDVGEWMNKRGKAESQNDEMFELKVFRDQQLLKQVADMQRSKQ